MNYEAAEKYALSRIHDELPETYYYHRLSHTQDVMKAVRYIAEGEQVSSEELDLLKAATVFHDLGFVETYADHEPVGARIAGEMLPGFGYSSSQVEKVKALILATALPYKPQNRLEMIIRDADLDYLGREDYLLIAHQLKLEWLHLGIIKSMKEWYQLQYQFLSNHNFYTDTARRHRQSGKENHIAQLRELLGL
ncbi:MAG: adenylate/guanylate cyclase [Bacteroidetes bacterium]|nr:MAG: adenylate/guanylate cyclase [Bacteroidota bacterium]